MINKPCWHCREFGVDGFVFIAVDQMLPDGTLVGLREAVHPFMLDNPRAELLRIVAKMTWMLSQAAQPMPASRARAFEITDEELAGLIQFRFGG